MYVDFSNLTESENKIFKIFLKWRSTTEASIIYNPEYEKKIKNRKAGNQPTVSWVFKKFKKRKWLRSEKIPVEVERTKFGKTQRFYQKKKRHKISLSKVFLDFLEYKKQTMWQEYIEGLKYIFDSTYEKKIKTLKPDFFKIKINRFVKKILESIFYDEHFNNFIVNEYTFYSNFTTIEDFCHDIIVGFELFHILGKQDKHRDTKLIASSSFLLLTKIKEFRKGYTKEFEKFLIKFWEEKYLSLTFEEKAILWTSILPEEIHKIFEKLLSHTERRYLLHLNDIISSPHRQ